MQKLLMLAIGLGVIAACGSQRSEAKAAAGAVAAASPRTSAQAGDMTPPPGVDISKLSDGEKKIFFRVGNKVGSACGKAHSLLTSVKTDPACRRSLYALRSVAKMAGDSFLESEITESIEKRYTQKPVQIDVGDAPMKGDPRAPVSIVEFADFECPHCRHLQPVLDRLLDDYRGQVRVYFKNFPLKSHTNAEGAALAAVAAQRQGKFWVLTAKLWHNQDALSAPDLEKYAKDAGLDLKRWKEDMGSPAVKERVAKDRAEGDRLNLSGTPAVYINGRECTEPSKDYDALKMWVDEELGVAR